MKKNRRQLREIMVVATVVLMLVSVGPRLNWSAQSDLPKVQQWWLNVPSSPLQIGLSPSKRDLELFNRSTGQVSQYRFGCIREVGEEIKAARRFPVTKTKLPSSQALINSVTLYSEQVAICTRDKTRLAVIEVGFKDGSVWRVK